MVLLINFFIFFYLAKYTVSEAKETSVKIYFIDNQIKTEVNREILLHYQLNSNFIKTYLSLIKNYSFFKFGNSKFYNTKIITLIKNSTLASLYLGLLSTLFIFIVGLFIAFLKLIAFNKKYFFINQFIDIILIFLYSVPLFALASFFNFYFESSLFFAILANTLSALLWFVLLFYNFLYQQTQTTYFLFGLSKGFTNRYTILKISLKNILLNIFADLPSIFIGVIFASSIFLENIFNINGIATLFYKSIVNYDYYLTLAIIYIIAFSGIVIRLITDIIYYKLDPNFKIIKKNVQN
jgi:ABC-type dipeptide/oligopeptide/nickel transport system permease component